VHSLPSLRWGIAGYGDVVSRRALPALQSLGQRIIGVWGRDKVRAQALAARYGTGVGTDSFDALLDRADAIYIATPVYAHVPLAMAALLAGRHVLLEKPLAGSLPHDPRDLLDAAANAGAVASVAYYRRFSPAVRFAADLLASVACERVNVQFNSPFAPGPADPKIWRTDPRLAGGGVLADAGSHRIDLLCMLFGQPTHIAGALTRHFPRGSERSAAVTLLWPGGCRADTSFEWSEEPPADRLSFASRELTIQFPDLDTGQLRVTRDGEQAAYHLPSAANPLTASFRDLLECVSTGREPACQLQDALLVDEVIRAAGQAHTLNWLGHATHSDRYQ